MGDSPSSGSPQKSPGLSRRLSSPRPSQSSLPIARSSSYEVTLLDNLQIGEVIGCGSFSCVCVAIDMTNRQQYAVKKVQLDRLDAEQYSLVQDEVRNMQSLDHRGLLKLKTCITWKMFCVMVMPLMTNRSCDQIISMAYPTGLPEAAVGLIMKDILNALAYLHGKNIIHRAIKASHILISETGAAVLSGFRYMLQIPPNQTRTTAVNNTLSEMTHYLNWLSPEMLMQDSSGFSLNSDMYSIGITACELANGVAPYSEVSPSAILVKKLQEPPPKLWDKYFLPSQEGSEVAPQHLSAGGSLKSNPQDQPFKKKNFSQHFKNFVTVCVVAAPAERISCHDAQKLKFITTYAKDSPSELLKTLPLLNPPLQYKPQSDEAATGDAHLFEEIEGWDFS